jgi:hypothetical protein
MGMKQLVLIPALLASLAATPAPAQTAEPETLDRFLQLLEDLTNDSQGFFENLLTELGPALSELQDTIEDWSNYAPPEVLPNGDIIIRRKPDAAPIEPKLPEGTKEI